MRWLLVVLAIVVVAGAVRFALTRRAPDGVEGFRRQIDALSSDARRPIVGRVNEAAGRSDQSDDPTDDDHEGGSGSTGNDQTETDGNAGAEGDSDGS